jgi:DNA-binding NarL/FixJ family response regulator
MKLLIADPDAASRKALILLLERRFGLSKVDEAGDVETLIRRLAEGGCAVLLLDWRLYGAPAPETCRILRMAYPDLKVFLLSVDLEDAPAAEAAGATFLHKGASPEEVMAILAPLFEQPS